MDNYFKVKVAEKRNRKNKRIPEGRLVRIHKEVGYVYSSQKNSTTVIVQRKNTEGFIVDTKIIVYERPLVIKDSYGYIKSPTNFHRKKRKIIKDQTNNLHTIIDNEYIIVPIANRKTLNWWDCGRYDYKL
jgi:hypothetical protein